MKGKIKELERQLFELAHNRIPPVESPAKLRSSNIETFSSSLSGNVHILHETRFPSISRSVTQKTRLFGQSHWVNGATTVSSIAIPVTCLSFKTGGLTFASPGISLAS